MAASVYLDKAIESLAGATSEAANGRFNNCANRAYYACYQAAIHALLVSGVRPRGNEWPHAYVHAELARRLIRGR